MIQQIRSAPCVVSLRIPTPRQWKALRLLCEAWVAARWEGQDIWQFAVEIDQLRAVDLSNTDLRCLLYWGYVEHARECTNAGMNRRIFQPLSALVLPKRTCFVLTAKGWETVSEFGAEKGVGVVASPGEPTALPCSRPQVPRWDRGSRRLWWQDRLVKEFRRSAVNQELVLTVLEEEGWPTRIDDPLPQTPGIDPKVRLHDTIKALNRHCIDRLICFQGDGTGWGVRWIVARRE
jgi:hypothetical protein